MSDKLSTDIRRPKDIHDIEIKAEEVVPELTSAEIAAWKQARRKTALRLLGKSEVHVHIGWPKVEEPLRVPVLAVAAFEDHWEVLARYGRTHRLSKAEVVRVEDVG